MFEIRRVDDGLPTGAVKNERTAVRGIICHEGKLLMVETNRGDYKFPGGGIKSGEKRKEALLREIREETGYTEILIGPCIGTVLEQNADTKEPGEVFSMKSFYYLCRLKDKENGIPVEGSVACPDEYEKKLGFKGCIVGVGEALEANRRLLSGGAGKEISWLSRETEVLKCLADSHVWEMALAVYECGQIVRDADRDRVQIDEKEGHANFVTDYDRRVQEELRTRLCAIVPEAVFVGEEEDIHASIGEGRAFIVDPIDGTTNFIRDYKCSSISVGMTCDGETEAGIVYNPYLDEMFTAEKGRGAYRNGEPVHVSEQPLERGIVLFGTAPYYETLSRRSFQMAYEYFCRALDVRRSGSAAIDLCNIACGRAEVFFELMLSPWDFAAGALIVEEAGGRVTTVDGGPLTLGKPCSVMAVNGTVE